MSSESSIKHVEMTVIDLRLILMRYMLDHNIILLHLQFWNFILSTHILYCNKNTNDCNINKNGNNDSKSKAKN